MTAPAAKSDATFSDVSLYGSSAWVAARLGRSVGWLSSHRARLVADAGFPKPDAITGHYVKADIDAWIARRRRLSDTLTPATTESPTVRIDNDTL